jgi:hypothetical protein
LKEVGAPRIVLKIIPSIDDWIVTPLMPVLPAGPGPPLFWFQKLKPARLNIPPRLNSMFPVKVPDETHELLGTVPASVALRANDDRPTPLTVFAMLVPLPEPISVDAVTPVISVACANGALNRNTDPKYTKNKAGALNNLISNIPDC